MRTVIHTSDAVRVMMESLGIKGRFDVREDGSRSTGYVGKPTGTDYEVIVTIKPLPPIGSE